MKFERTKNSTRTFGYGMVYKIVVTLLPFATRTVIIYKLGADYLGLSSLFTSLLSMLNMSELGIGSAITFCLYKPVAEDDKASVSALLNLIRRLYNIMGIVIFGLGLALLPFLNHFISGSYPDNINIYILYLIYLLNTGISYVLFSYKNVLFEVYQRGDILHKIKTIVEVAKYLLQIIILLFFEDYYLYALMLPVSQIFINICTDYMSKKKFPDIKPVGNPTKEVTQIIKSRVLCLSAQSILSTFTNSIDNIVMSATIGLIPIAIYGNYSYTSSSILGILMIAYRSLKPTVGNIMNSDSDEKNLRIYNALSFMGWWISTACAICMICLYQPFITLWVGSEYLMSMFAVFMVVAYFYINSQRQFLTTVYISSAGLWNKTLVRTILITISNLILDIVLVKPFGIAGIVFASFFTHAIFGLPLDIQVVYKYILHLKPRSGLIKMILRSLISLALGLLTYLVSVQVPFNGILGLLLRGVCAVVIPNLIIFTVCHKRDDFKFLMGHLKFLLSK